MRIAFVLYAIALLLTGATLCGAQPSLELQCASVFGTGGDDNFEAATVGPDGNLYLVGNAACSIDDPAAGVKPSRFGTAVGNPQCPFGFVLKLSSDGSTVLAYAEFAAGILHATTVAVTEKGVYIGGYASHGLEPLLKDRGGLIADYPLREELDGVQRQAKQPRDGQSKRTKDIVAGRPWLGALGAPCVLRLSADLKAITSGTYLEGWQQVYEKNRVCGAGRRKLPGTFREYFWQPTSLCPLESGDIVVAHDGGYSREQVERDYRLARELSSAEARDKLLGRLRFYDVADHVSRLSGDLSRRAWKTDIHTPRVDPAAARKSKPGWSLPHYGNPRTHRMRMDGSENLWVCGWSATATSREPWWSPFLWRLNPSTGKPTRRLYDHDPMSGSDHRMGGWVADTAVLSVAVADDGELLTCLISDGGNSWMVQGPRGGEKERMKGPVIGPGLGPSPAHFWGQVHRVDAKSFDGLGGARSGPWAWQVDVAGLPSDHILAVGRWNHPLPWTDDAWWTQPGPGNPNAFIRVIDPDYRTVFWTAVPGFRPFELTPIGDGRYIISGFAEGDAAPLKGSLVAKAQGGRDGYFMIVRWQ